MFKPFSNIDKIVKEKNIKINYTDGYKHWKKRFDEEYKKTHDVKKALDEIHGKPPKGEN